MRKTLMLGVVTATIALGAPAVAQAHHITQYAATCALTNGSPTITATADYADFSDGDKAQGVYRELYVDGQRVAADVINWSGPSHTDVVARTSSPGAHAVFYAAAWATGSGHSDVLTVSCPAPPVVTPTPTPPPIVTPTPTPTPPVLCNGKPLPAGATSCEHKTIKPCVKPRVHLKVYPRRRLHGEVVFVASGVKAADVASTRWYERRSGHRWQRVGTSGRPWERLAHHGLSWHIYLWVEQVWGFPQWGPRQVRVVVRTRAGGGTCAGVARAQIDYFNRDPEPRARNWG